MADLRWQSMGGTLLDGNGDLAVTLSPLEERSTMAATRLKAAVNAWKSYPGIGAGLDSYRGNPIGITQDTELSLQRAVIAAPGQVPLRSRNIFSRARARETRRAAGAAFLLHVLPGGAGLPSCLLRQPDSRNAPGSGLCGSFRRGSCCREDSGSVAGVSSWTPLFQMHN